MAPKHENEGPEGVLVEVAASELLPATCPSCLAPGTRPLLVFDLNRRQYTEEEAFYCDLCADALERARTRALALTAGCSLLAVSVVVALALHWGSFYPFRQVLLGVLASTLPALLLYTFRIWPRDRYAIHRLGNQQRDAEPQKKRSRRYWVRQRPYAQAMAQARITGDAPPALERKTGRATFPSGLFFPLLLSALTFVMIQSFGRSTVRVLVPGVRTATLVIDDRRAATIMGAPDENPRAGSLTGILGGVRELALIDDDGGPVASGQATLWPGGDYVFGRPPPGYCLYVEEKAYGEAGDRHLLVPLSEPGPVWELEEDVDQWFVPLPERDELPTTGGIRRAVRLLPCR